MRSKLEALVDAIGSINGAHNPESDCYRIANPLMIRSFARPGKHEVDEAGRRVFHSWLSGYKAAVFDANLKVAGKSRANVGPNDPLEALLKVYGVTELGGQDQVVKFLRRALKDATISRKTLLSFFIEAHLPESE